MDPFDTGELEALKDALRRALDKCADQRGISAPEAYERLTDIPTFLLVPALNEKAFGRGAPRKINYELALYLMFTFEEILKTAAPLSPLPFSRPNSDVAAGRGGAPGGPAFEALLAALAVAQWRLQYQSVAPLYYSASRFALASLIEVTRSKAFQEGVGRHGAGRDPTYFISSASTLALMVRLARECTVKVAKARKKRGSAAD